MESRNVLLLVVATICVLGVNSVVGRNCAPADKNCTLPDCLCPDWNPPNELDVETQTPQLVFMTFDDAITISNYPLYEQFLLNRLNPNGHNVTATFFITHEYNNYQLTHDLYRRGHGIALHSITHRTDTTYWQTINATVWAAEVCDQRRQMEHFARIPPGYIKGFRVPFLQLGGDTQYSVLSSADCALKFDSSRPTRTYSGNTPYKLWPYTMDFDTTFQDCQNGPCPVESYPGFWTIPMVSWLGGNGFPCAMLDNCVPVPATQQETYDLLKANFDSHYVLPSAGGIGNRAPFNLFTHAAWLQGEDNEPRLRGWIQFLDYLQGLEDVYIVSIEKGMEWLKNPVLLEDIKTFEPFLNKPMPTDQCGFPFNCAFTNDQTPFPGERYMVSCQPCPRNYPWIYNYLGQN